MYLEIQIYTYILDELLNESNNISIAMRIILYEETISLQNTTEFIGSCQPSRKLCKISVSITQIKSHMQ
jgi:hypothetical protein